MKKGVKDEPEIALSELEAWRAGGDATLLAKLKEATGKSESALTKALAAEPDRFAQGKLRTACGSDEAIFRRVLPFSGLIRLNRAGRHTVIRAGGLYVTAGSDRSTTGAHYTPRSLTEPIVQYTLEPLVYDGPAEGQPREQWKLLPPKALLALNICDPAMGSGAFLVQACRWLAERLVESWTAIERDTPPPSRTGGPSADPSAHDDTVATTALADGSGDVVRPPRRPFPEGGPPLDSGVARSGGRPGVRPYGIGEESPRISPAGSANTPSRTGGPSRDASAHDDTAATTALADGSADVVRPRASGWRGNRCGFRRMARSRAATRPRNCCPPTPPSGWRSPAGWWPTTASTASMSTPSPWTWPSSRSGW
jgi:hypothetical protein